MIPENYNYKPLPKDFTLMRSKIEGFGVFPCRNIEKDEQIGITHIEYKTVLFRTPLGGYINDGGDKPNCRLEYIDEDKTILAIFANEYIPSYQELTLDYSKCPCGEKY